LSQEEITLRPKKGEGHLLAQTGCAPATFDNTATNQSITFSSSPISVGGWTLNSANYNFTIGSGQYLTFDGAGIINNGANNVDSFAITNDGRLDFSDSSSVIGGSLSTTITTNSGGHHLYR
jgi:hypothetical protein